ncbi:MAG: cobalamin-dependent protein [Acidobacteriota bacterium]
MRALLDDASSLLRLAVAITDAQLERMPALAVRYGARGRQHCIDDTVFHLTYLREAVTFGDATLFEDYIAWAKVMLASRGVDADDLVANLEQMRTTLGLERDHDSAATAVAVVEHVLNKVEAMPDDAETFLGRPGALEETARHYLDAIRIAKRHDADAVIQEAVRGGASISDLYLRVFEPVQNEIGRLWQMNRISVAQEHFCTAAVQRSMSQLYGQLFTGKPGRRRVVAACAGGELHEIGLRMVTDLLEADGWDTVYLGANVPVDSIVSTVAAAPTGLVAISATITPHLRELTSLIASLRTNPATSHVPIIVGGYPFRLSDAISKHLGVDGWAANATDAVRLANEITLTL